MRKFCKLLMLGCLLMLLVTNTAYSAQKEVLLKTTSTWDKSEYKTLKIKKPEVTVLKIVIGVGESLAIHKHDLINVVYVKQGTLTVITDKNDKIIIKEGEVFPELIGKYHYGKNTGDKPIELIVFYIGEKGTPLSVNKK